jgi:secretion/DNA translocation related TadE-like protein
VSPPARDPERGAGTVLMLGMAAVVLLLGLALAALGAAEQARGSAQAAADHGALAAAPPLRDGLDPCGAAREAVSRNHAELEACVPEDDGVVDVTVRRAAAVVPGWAGGKARAQARAGPRPGAATAAG